MSPITPAFLDLPALEARPARELPTLPGVVLHLFSLDRCAQAGHELAARLSPAETRRAREINDPARRSGFIASRALLRAALSEFVGGTIAPANWNFGTGSCGKPFLEGGQLSFSLSYTRATLAIAVSRKYELGLDIEAVDPESSQEVPWQVLTNAERAHIRALPETDRFLEFLRLWTFKEAYTKYLGLGAMLDFRQVEVSLARTYASAPQGPDTPFVAPLLNQQVLEIGGETNVLVVAAGRVRSAFAG